MNVLDENIRQDQGTKLHKWGIKFRFLIRDMARAGIQDPDVIPLLHHCKHPTLFSHDSDFYYEELIHRDYCLAWLDVFDGEAAGFIRRFLRHPTFDTHAKRMGKVVRVHPGGVHYWQINTGALQKVKW